MESSTTLAPGVDGAWRFDGFEGLDTCHLETQRMLGQLAALVDQIERTGSDRDVRRRATAIEHHFSVTMREHHEDEERHIFPALASSGDERTAQAVACLLQDHFWLDADWRELSPLLDAAASGQSCDLDALRRGVEIFAALSHDHIALEESLIYPQARQRMADCDRQSMNREMAQRRHGNGAGRVRGG